MTSLNIFLDSLTDERRKEFFLQLANIALEHYSIGEFVPVFLQHNSGIAYQIESSDHKNNYLLKIHEPVGTGSKASFAQIQTLMEWLTELVRTSSLIVQTPLKNLDGAFVTRAFVPEIGETVFCTMQNWIEGEHPNGDFTIAQAEAVGAMMATLHQAGSHWQSSTGFRLADYRLPNLIDEARQLQVVINAGIISNEQFSGLERAVQRIEQIVNGLGDGADVYGLIHGDLHHENILFLGKQVCPIDFDGLKNSYYLFDLGTTLYHILYQNVEFRNALVNGYSAVRKLSGGEYQCLEAFVTWSAINNLAFQSTISKQIKAEPFARNMRQLTNEFSAKLISGEPFVLI